MTRKCVVNKLDVVEIYRCTSDVTGPLLIYPTTILLVLTLVADIIRDNRTIHQTIFDIISNVIIIFSIIDRAIYCWLILPRFIYDIIDGVSKCRVIHTIYKHTHSILDDPIR